MDDLISRRAAIAYAISGRVRTLPSSEDGENWIRTEDVRQSLLTMPSADIDLSDYSDRLWRNAYEQGKAVSKDALDEAYAHGYTVAEADFHKQSQWIPVTERLPEDGERVLLQIAEVCLYGDSYVEDYYYVSGSRSKGRWFINVHPDVSVERGGIIAYMPLPEPWKGEDDEEST